MRRRTGSGPVPASRRERGAVLVIAALGMVGVLAVAAIVVDLGRLRGTRRQAQSATDLAALAAGYYLSGHGTADGEAVSDPEAACQAALVSVKANVPDFPDGASINCNGLPDTGTTPNCTSLTPSKTITASDTGSYTFTLTYPVPASMIADSRYATGAGVSDGQAQCERMEISLERTNNALFAGIVGVSSLETDASTVLRADTANLGQGVAALLLLERVACGTLQTSGGGSGGAGIVVRASGPLNPGVIQADSAGPVGPLCTTNQNAGGYVVWGEALPSASGGGPSIRAEDSPGGVPGIIGLRSLAVGGRGGAVEVTGIWPRATASDIMSRRGADVKYNRPVAEGGSAQITSLHARTYARTTWTAATAVAQGYRVISGPECSGLDTAVTPVPETLVFFDCANGFAVPNNVSVILPNATDVIFSGKITVPNGSLLSLPNVQRLHVRGCASGPCSGGNYYSVSVAGELRVNTGGDGTTATACSNRRGPGAGGTNTNWTEFSTLGGPFLVTSNIRMCQTSLYLGQNAPEYVRRTVTKTGPSQPENYPAIAACSDRLPCPSNSGGNASISITGGSGTVDWSAPNQLSTAPSFADLAIHPFEDLALWTESSANSYIKGQGSSRTEGIYFSPNSRMEFSGQATQSQPLNAQFLSRTLNVTGQGTLDLRPNPEDSIITPMPGTTYLIR